MRHTRTLSIFALATALTACGPADDDSAAPDANDDDTGSTCAIRMQDAPLAPAGYSYQDSLPTATFNTWDGVTVPTPGEADYPGGKYRTLTPDSNGKIHPGCTVEGLSYTPASIPGYPCAAKEYPFPSGVTEDTSKPIFILVHGNSSSPSDWEPFLHDDPGSLDWPADTVMREQLSTLLPAKGYRTIAVDMRITLVDDPVENNDTENAARNIDHGWAVPIAQELIKRVIEANPGRKISVVGFSLGATVVRDALRRLWVEWDAGTWDQNVFEHLDQVFINSGANHGVSSFALCSANNSMRGTVTCEMGQRNTYTQTTFHKALNGPPMSTGGSEFGGWWETPCADGDYAFGKRGVCGGNKVLYTTMTMSDMPDGTQQDLFVSEHASRLYPTECANNEVNGLNDYDTSAYFLNGILRNHYGSVRSERGLAEILQQADK